MKMGKSKVLNCSNQGKTLANFYKFYQKCVEIQAEFVFYLWNGGIDWWILLVLVSKL